MAAAPISRAVNSTALIPFAPPGYGQAIGCAHALTEPASKLEPTMTIVARAVGGQARRPRILLANRNQKS